MSKHNTSEGGRPVLDAVTSVGDLVTSAEKFREAVRAFCASLDEAIETYARLDVAMQHLMDADKGDV